MLFLAMQKLRPDECKHWKISSATINIQERQQVAPVLPLDYM